ncbi:MAG: type IV pilus modification protein PilV [Pseudomonadales bacterium]|nr:type IV pilus modification protein PilV [Pseudomonadales bacterium]
MFGNTHQQRPQRGFTLIEVMVAVLVLSVGLLGIASLLSVTKRSEHQAWQRSLALSLADGIVERIRVNPGSAVAYDTGGGALGGGTIVTMPTDCTTQSCSTAQMAAWDLWEWERRLDGAAIRDADTNSVGGLIEPHGCIVFQSAGGTLPNTGKLRVVVSWRGLTDTSDAVPAAGQICGPGNAGTLASRRQVVVNTYVIDEGDLL